MGFEWLFMTALYTAMFVLAGWAFVDALFRPSTSFVAAGKLTKPAWAGITGLAALVEFSMTPFALFGVPFAGSSGCPGSSPRSSTWSTSGRPCGDCAAATAGSRQARVSGGMTIQSTR